MNRRYFFGALAGLLSLFGRREPSYTYDWQAGETDDPRFAGKNLAYGGEDVHQVFLNDKSLDWYIQALKTGPDGWVSVQIRRQDEAHVTEIWDNWNGRWRTWIPTPLYPKFREYVLSKYGVDLGPEPEDFTNLPSFQQLRPENPNLPRWGEERLLTRKVYGTVRYEYYGESKKIPKFRTVEITPDESWSVKPEIHEDRR